MTPATTSRRRGLTLIELLVTVALMLLIMTVIVKIFQETTTAMTSARTDQDLAQVTRRIDAQLRQDLSGATARFTPPLNPKFGLGYFEYSENMFADGQGEDTDDSISFTAKAPPGQPFTGRIMLPQGVFPVGTARAGEVRFAPTVITSEFAEIIYFLRHGNLYRRVLLIVPERDLSQTIDAQGAAGNRFYRYYGGAYDLDGDDAIDISWQGGNDISTRPPPSRILIDPAAGTYADTQRTLAPIPNTLGDLTNRENRAFRPRFSNDHFRPGATPTGSPRIGPDGLADDFNQRAGGTYLGDGVEDYYPTLYPGNPAVVINSPGYIAPNNLDVLAFPFVFPPRYSRSYSSPRQDPYASPGGVHGGPLTSAGSLNHSPLDLGDNLPIPSSPTAAPVDYWTYWGFPTWRETRSPIYNGATRRVNDPGFAPVPGRPDPEARQGFGLSRLVATETLPAILHWYSDGAGSSPQVYYPSDSSPFGRPAGFTAETWALNYAPSEEDLIATNVRSFDIKAFDPQIVLYNGSAYDVNGDGTPDSVPFTPRYADLGYAAQFKLPANGFTFDGEPTWPTAFAEAATLGHEGRMPPLHNTGDLTQSDNRIDPQAAALFSTPLLIGDFNESVVRMRRTWDSWSTDYAFAPMNGLNFVDPNLPPGFPTGPPYAGRPAYPSYPAPYPAPLYGIQIQIRLADPENQKLKILTVRQDFTAKL